MTVIFNASKFLSKINKIIRDTDDFKQDLLEELAIRTEEHIVTRTRQKGTDQNGNKFKRYAPSTVKKKRKERAESSFVTLTETGAMLNSVSLRRIDRFKGRAVVGILRRREQKKARFHIRGRGKLPKRDFMGVTRQFKEKQEIFATRFVARRIRRLGLK